jgi:AmmeMemoRadiSam system protein A
MPSTEDQPLAPDLRLKLLRTARGVIAHTLDHADPLPIHPHHFPAILQENRASFVTLTLSRQLRGCIGTLQAIRPLIEDIAKNAYAAAFQDPRFTALSRDELGNIVIHISILGPSNPIEFRSEQELLQLLRPGIDGLTIEQDTHHATFLPTVWEMLPAPTEFLAHLKHKAGIRADCDPRQTRAWRYTTETFSE